MIKVCPKHNDWYLYKWRDVLTHMDTHIQRDKRTMQKQRENLERFGYKPGNTKCCQKPPGARKQAQKRFFPQSHQRELCHTDTLISELLGDNKRIW